MYGWDGMGRMLLGSVALAGLIAVTLAYRNFFTPAHQLREQPEP